jgi:hypothetical protein
MSSDIHTAIKALDLIYTRLLRQADALRRGADNIRTMERLLDQTRPVTEEDRNLAFFICLMASFKRGDLVAFLFKIRRACLLLLIDGQAAATALRLADTHVIWIDAHGRHHINPIGDAPPAGGIAAPNVAPAGADASVRHGTSERPRSGRRGPRAATAAAGKVRNPNRPVMDCQDLIAKIDAPDSVGPPSNPEASPPSGASPPPLPETATPAAAGREPSYLAALIRGGAAPAAAAPAAAAPRMRPATPAPIPRPAAALPPFDVVPTNIRWGDIDDIDHLGDIDDMHLVDLGPIEMF